MAKLDEAFLEKLLAAFATEAAERLQSVNVSLTALEALPEDDRRALASDEARGLVETVFRETHSLKGAARAVGQPGVELLCQRMESIFAGLKAGRLILDDDLLDDLHAASTEIGRILAGGSGQDGALSGQDIAMRLERRIGARGGPSDGPARPIASSRPDFETFLGREPPAEQGAGLEIPPAFLAEEAAPGEPEPAPDQDSPRFVETGAGNASPPPASQAPADARPALPPSSPAAPAEGGGLLRVEAARLEELLLRAEEMLASKSGLERRAVVVADLVAETRGLWGVFQEAMTGLRGLIENRAGREDDFGAAQERDSRPERIMDLLEDAAPRLDRLRARLGQLSLETDRGQAALSGQVEALLSGLKDVLMLPLSSLFEAMPKIARDLARGLGKNVRLETAGGDVRLDRRILDELRDPLTHLIRNAADHGIESPEARRASGKPEQGRIVLRAARIERDKVEIVLADDGAGLDANRIREAAVRRGLVPAAEAEAMPDEEVVRLVFKSDLSTSPIITDISGRGLGLAIVAEKVERLGGSVSIVGQPGQGAAFSLTLPVTMSSFRGLIAECAGRVLVIAKTAVERALLVEPERMRPLRGRDVLFLDDRPLPVSPLADLLELSPPPKAAGAVDQGPLTVLVLRAGARRAGVIVDALLGEEELMVKDLGKQLRRVRNVAGLTLLGSGRLAPILHGPDLVKAAHATGAGRSARVAERPAPVRKTVLVAEDSITSRTLIANILEAAGYRALTAVDGRKALEMILARPPDLLVSDVQMPVMDGFELTARLRETAATAELPVVLVTSLDSREDRERGVQAGANAYIVKSSFDQSNLLDVIAKLI